MRVCRVLWDDAASAAPDVSRMPTLELPEKTSSCLSTIPRDWGLGPALACRWSKALPLNLEALCNAMPSGGLLRIDLQNSQTGDRSPPELLPGDYMVVSIGDTGTGMGRGDARARIRTLFYDPDPEQAG
jgi:hypothetical protein